MAAILPFLLGALLVANLALSIRCWRRCVLLGALLWGTLVVAITEGLSAARMLAFVPVAIAWGSVLVALAVVLVWRVRGRGHCDPLNFGRLRWPATARWYLAALAILVGIVGLVAIVAPPNTWDSQTYHLPRVMHWIQNRSVDHYPAANDRQLWNPPWCEFAIAQLHILSDGDRLDNLVQFVAMLLGTIAVSLIVAQLRGALEAQWLAAVVAATLPMGVLQASSTQNDWSVACWILCLLVCVLEVEGRRASEDGRGARDEGEESWWRLSADRGWAIAACAGMALGLALVTKGTALLYCAPIGLWLAWSLAPRPSSLATAWRWTAKLALAAGVALLLTAGHYYRNWRTFGNPLSSARARQFLCNASIGSSLTLSNLIRNAAIHLQTPWRRVDDRLADGVARLHRELGLDVNDPRSTYLDSRFQITPYYVHEDYAGNPWHLLLSLAAVATLGATAVRQRDGPLVAYAGCIVAMCLLESAVLRWQPWNSRLQLPIFAAAAPLVALMLSRFMRPRPARAIAAALLLLALPAAIGGTQRSLTASRGIFGLPRAQAYFIAAPKRQESFDSAGRRLRAGGYRDIGLVLAYDAWEYPLWLELNPTGTGPVRLRHVAPLDASLGAFAFPIGQPPEVLIVSAPNQLDRLTIAGRTYTKTWSSADLDLFSPK